MHREAGIFNELLFLFWLKTDKGTVHFFLDGKAPQHVAVWESNMLCRTTERFLHLSPEQDISTTTGKIYPKRGPEDQVETTPFTLMKRSISTETKTNGAFGQSHWFIT